jgi:hypothetical protein
MSMAKEFTHQELEQQAETIMQNFDFKKVQKHMQDTNHQWYMGGGRMAVPDIMDLRVTARDLITKAIYDESVASNVGTGGFVAYKLPWGMQLTFQIAWVSAC